jgi:hypothetical protein
VTNYPQPVDRARVGADHPGMAEYALVTAVVASLAVAFGSLTGSQLSQLPVTAARAQILVVQAAKANSVPASTARATLARAPYQRPALRYLYASGWIGGRKSPADCLFAKATPESTQQRFADSIRTDPKVVAALRKMRVTVAQAAGALRRGTADAC